MHRAVLLLEPNRGTVILHNGEAVVGSQRFVGEDQERS